MRDRALLITILFDFHSGEAGVDSEVSVISLMKRDPLFHNKRQENDVVARRTRRQ